MPTLTSDEMLSVRVIVEHYRSGELIETRDEGTGNLVVGFINALVTDAVTGTSVIPTFARYKYLACGTSSTSEVDTQTALGAEVETRSACTYSQFQVADGSNNAGILDIAGTVNFTGPHTVNEIGLFDVVTTSAGNMMDRKVVGPYTLLNGDSLAVHLRVNLPAGG